MTITTDTTDQLTGTTWRLDPEGSTAEFSVGALWGLTTVHGRFDRLAGTVDADGRMELTIEAASFDTGNRRRDRHLRSPDFFDCDRHPEVPSALPVSATGRTAALASPASCTRLAGGSRSS